MEENFPGKPKISGFFQRFPDFSRVGVPNLKKNKKTPKALKLHLQSIKL
jgi:hypothetical protein